MHTYTGNKGCSDCAKLAGKKWAERNRDHNLKRMRDWRLANLERAREAVREWHKRNVPKDQQIERIHRWAKDNPGLKNANVRRYQTRKINAMPVWLTVEQIREMDEFYVRAREMSSTSIKFHVDHIVPLRGLLVCGLHVPWNLQVIPASENARKGNK